MRWIADGLELQSLRWLVTAALASSSIALAALAPPAAAQPATTVIGYFGSWSIYDRDVHVADIPASDLSHVDYAFVGISPALECELSDPWADVQKPYAGDGDGPVRGNLRQLQILKEQHPHLRVLLAIGGWTLSGRFSDAALTASSREHFARSCVQLMAQYGLDGLDVDWEFPVSGGLPTNTTRPEDEQNFTLLLAEMRQELDAQAAVDGRPYLLTAAVPASPGAYANFELEQIHAYVDWLGVMAYDFQGSWSAITSFHAPLFAPADDPPAESDVLNADSAVAAYRAAGVPDEKIVLGVPLYGRGWKDVAAANNGLFQPHGGVPAGTYEPGMFDYRDLAANYVPSYAHFVHPQAQAEWLYSAGDGVMIAYDGPETVAAKAVYAAANGLHGVMVWDIAADDEQYTLIRTLAGGVQSDCPASPPTTCDAAARTSMSAKTSGDGKVTWSFNGGNVARVPGDFGMPTSATAHTLCVYQAGALTAQTRMPAGSGWRATSKGYAYKSASGATAAMLSAGPAGKPKVKVRGRGASAPLPSLPVAQPIDVTIALVNDTTPVCWSATYAAARKNDAAAFSARTP